MSNGPPLIIFKQINYQRSFLFNDILISFFKKMVRICKNVSFSETRSKAPGHAWPIIIVDYRRGVIPKVW
ncbi:MAG: hypothetical protein CVT49_13840 [candidate division Zixibacteria bacterium HGW-Zixibacteria-1]|nr:MAG: hypothetical protein CVT49_13840 [candidate division Zixibacteria bacterium HGW-Zixibacteria-1]